MSNQLIFVVVLSVLVVLVTADNYQHQGYGHQYKPMHYGHGHQYKPMQYGHQQHGYDYKPSYKPTGYADVHLKKFPYGFQYNVYEKNYYKY